MNFFFFIWWNLLPLNRYTKQGTLKESSDCAPTNGYYFIPIYDKGEYLLKIEPPSDWYFEPKEVLLNFDGINDPCSKGNDINFIFKGFSVHGKVYLVNSIVENLLNLRSFLNFSAKFNPVCRRHKV